LPASAVAVLIVNYKTYGEVEQALASVEGALRPGDEVVVFDQASDPARVAAVAARHPVARWIRDAANVGFAAGVNRAAATTTAPLLMLLNPDGRLGPAVIETLAGYLDAHPDVGIVGPRVLNEDGTLQASARRFPSLSTVVAGRSTWLSRRFPNNWLTRRNLLARDATGAETVDWIAGSCLMTRRDLFARLGGLDEGFFMYWEDADYARRAADAGFRSVHLPAVVVAHAGGRAAALNRSAAIRAFHRSAYLMYWKHSGAAARLAGPIVKVFLWLRGEVEVRRAARRARPAAR